MIASSYRGTIGYAESSAILRKEGLELDRSTFYNLQRKDSAGSLLAQEEARLLLAYLDQPDLYVEVDEVYILDIHGQRQNREIYAIA